MILHNKKTEISKLKNASFIRVISTARLVSWPGSFRISQRFKNDLIFIESRKILAWNRKREEKWNKTKKRAHLWLQKSPKSKKKSSKIFRGEKEALSCNCKYVNTDVKSNDV